MRSLFESLAWQALGLPPEITPAPNRGNKTNATADGFDLLSPASDRSWLELSDNSQTPSADWPAGEQEWTAATEPPSQGKIPQVPPSAPPEPDAQKEEAAANAPRNAADTDAKQNASATSDLHLKLQKNTAHAPERFPQYPAERMNADLPPTALPPTAVDAPHTELPHTHNRDVVKLLDGSDANRANEARHAAEFARADTSASHDSPSPASSEAASQSPTPHSAETQSGLHVEAESQFSPLSQSHAPEQENSGDDEHPPTPTVTTQPSTDARPTPTSTHVTAALKSDTGHAQVQRETPNHAVSEDSAIDHRVPAQLPHPVTRNSSTPQRNPDASTLPRNVEAPRSNHDAATPRDDRTAPHESPAAEQREEDSHITPALKPAPATYCSKGDASASRQSLNAELDQTSIKLEPQHPVPAPEAAASLIAAAASVATAHHFSRQEISHSASDEPSTADIHNSHAFAEPLAAPGTQHKKDESPSAEVRPSSLSSTKVPPFLQQTSTPPPAKPQLRHNKKLETAPAISRNLPEAATSHAALATSAATGISPQQPSHISPANSSDCVNEYANSGGRACAGASASPATDPQLFNTNFSASFNSQIDTPAASHAFTVQPSQIDPPQAGRLDDTSQTLTLRVDSAPAQMASYEARRHQHSRKPDLVTATRHEPTPGLLAPHLQAPATADALPARAFPETNQYSANITTTASDDLPTSQSASPQPIIEAAPLPEDLPTELLHTHHRNTPEASPFFTRTNPEPSARHIPSIESPASASPAHLATYPELRFAPTESSTDASTQIVTQHMDPNFFESGNAAMQQPVRPYSSAPAALSLPQPTLQSITTVLQQAQSLHEIPSGEESAAPLEIFRKRINSLSRVGEATPTITTSQPVLRTPQQKPAMAVPGALPVQSRSALPAPLQTADALYFPRSIPRRMETSSEPVPLRIDIGRIDVERADVSVAPSARTRRARPIVRFTLDQYLKQRSRSR